MLFLSEKMNEITAECVCAAMCLKRKHVDAFFKKKTDRTGENKAHSQQWEKPCMLLHCILKRQKKQRNSASVKGASSHYLWSASCEFAETAEVLSSGGSRVV